MFKITFRTGCRILFQRILRRGQRVLCWLHVALVLLAVHSYIVQGQRYFFWYNGSQLEVFGLILRVIRFIFVLFVETVV
jgi:hypothetical protein